MAQAQYTTAPAPRITVIDPRTPEQAKLRVAAYARVSSDSADQVNSYLAQVDYFTRYISGHEDWDMVDIYADEGISGLDAKKRDDFNRMMADCRDGKIDRVLCKSISRFVRNTQDYIVFMRELLRLGVTVYFEKEYIQNGGNPCKIRISAVFLCPFVAYLSLKSASRYWKIVQFIRFYAANHCATQF